MTIEFSELRSTEESLFRSSHWVHTEAIGNRHLVTLTGIAIIDFPGSGADWRRERLGLTLRFPNIFPGAEWLQVEHWAPFVTINAIANVHESVNAGWAVDEFEGPGPVKIRDGIKIWANIAVRDVDGYLIRVGYSVTVSGYFIAPPEGPV